MLRTERQTLVEFQDTLRSRGGGVGSWIVLAVVGVAAALIGFALPHFLAGEGGRRPVETEPTTETTDGSRPAYVKFGDLTVNLSDERLTRYLRVNLTLMVDSTQEEAVKQAVEKNRTLLKSWLIGYLSDKTPEDVRGAMGVNRSRREIQDQFNRLLFPDGSDRIQDVLFEEFIVQ